ncbi:microfibril-associated glycoprotein 4-like [Styela clava]
MYIFGVLLFVIYACTFVASRATSRYSFVYSGSRRPKSCRDVSGSSGLYTLYPDGLRLGVQVYCDMATNGGGWTVFQRRQDGSVNFYKNWSSYKYGFGLKTGEFWLGLEVMRDIMKGKIFELRIDLENWTGKKGFAKYSIFSIGDECVGYRLNVRGFSSSHSKLGDSMAWHNNQKFSTRDRDNDSAFTKCALRHKGGWWYNECRHSNLNGIYWNGGNYKSVWADGIDWFHWNYGGPFYSLKRTEMKFR